MNKECARRLLWRPLHPPSEARRARRRAPTSGRELTSSSKGGCRLRANSQQVVSVWQLLSKTSEKYHVFTPIILNNVKHVVFQTRDARRIKPIHNRWCPCDNHRLKPLQNTECLTLFTPIILNKVKHAHLRLRPTGEQPFPIFSPLAKKEARLPRRPGWRARRPESDGGLSAGPSLLFFRLRPARQSPVASLGSGLVFKTRDAQRMRQTPPLEAPTPATNVRLWRRGPQHTLPGSDASANLRLRPTGKPGGSRAHVVSAPGQFTTGGVRMAIVVQNRCEIPAGPFGRGLLTAACTATKAGVFNVVDFNHFKQY